MRTKCEDEMEEEEKEEEEEEEEKEEEGRRDEHGRHVTASRFQAYHAFPYGTRPRRIIVCIRM